MDWGDNHQPVSREGWGFIAGFLTGLFVAWVLCNTLIEAHRAEMEALRKNIQRTVSRVTP